MRWPTLPTPIETHPGLLRWTPVEGATGYTVWYLFPTAPSKKFTVYTNVADQREWYTFHQGARSPASSSGASARFGVSTASSRTGSPPSRYGPWSPIYTTKNPAFATGALKPLGGTLSDTVSTPGSPTRTSSMPAFLFRGNTGLFGQATELYRVYVFTDRDCINTVFKGAIVGGPAYAPRPFGPLAPADEPDRHRLRAAELPPGREGAARR